MARTYEQRQAAKLDRYLASLSEESEFFGLLGTGYPGSFYKVYVRPTIKGREWWRFESSAGPSTTDPIKHQAKLPVTDRAAAVWCPLPFLADYTHDPAKQSIGLLIARAKELRPTRSA
jgi:hypothetical protein